MGDYNRTTKDCSFSQLRPENHAAIQAYASKHEFLNFEGGILACCETTSEKKKKGLFGGMGSDPDPVNYTALVLTRDLLMWARSGPKSGTIVAHARLKDLEVRKLGALFEAKGLKAAPNDTGVEVFGLISDYAERVSAFLPLGSELAAQRFEAALKQAAQQAKA